MLLNRIKSISAPKALLFLVPLVILGFLMYLWGAQWGHGLWRFFRLHLYFVLILGVAAAIAVRFFRKTMIPYQEKGSSYGHDWSWRDWAFGGIILGGLLVAIGILVAMPYFRGQAYYQSVAYDDKPAQELSFNERAPYDVAQAVSNRNLGATTGDSTGMVKSIPNLGENSIFSTSIIKRGWFQGYESIQMIDLPLYGSTGSSNVKFCEYSDAANLRFGGMAPSNNLVRSIYNKTSPSVKAHREDAVAVCEGETPMLYIPLTKLEGFFVPHDVPAGVAIYNGETGELTIEDNYEGDLPLYPSSIAEKQRNASKSSGSFFDYIFGRVGYEDTSSDEDDPNGENRAEFSLSNSDQTQSFYVTPLTSRGSSSSIVAAGVLNSNTVTDGELQPYTIYQYADGESRQANSSIADSITGGILSGYQAEGLTVFEIVPGEDGNWVASIGKAQQVLYRAIIAPDGSIKLYNQNGDLVNSVDNNEGEGEVNDLLKTPIEDMTPEQLEQLGNEILKELAKRSDGG